MQAVFGDPPIAVDFHIPSHRGGGRTFERDPFHLLSEMEINRIRPLSLSLSLSPW